MITYVASIPAGAVRREIDGYLYAYTDLKLKHLPSGKVTVIHTDGDVRMLRVREIHPTNGTASIVIGKVGDAIASTVNLPFSVTVEVSE